MSPTAHTAAEPTIDDSFDLDIVIVPGRTPARVGQAPDIHFDTDDNCGQTCESACSPSCTENG